MLRTEGFRKYFANTSWMFADRVVRLGTVLVTGIYIARYLGDAQFGQLNYAAGFVGLFFALTAMGLDEIVVRDLVKHPDRRDELLGSAALMKLLGALLLAVLVFAGTFVNHMDGSTTIMVMIIAAAELFKPFSVIEYLFQSQVKGRWISQVNIVQTLVSSAFKLALVAIQAPLIWFAWAYVVDTLAAAVGFQVAYSGMGLRMREWRTSARVLRHLLQQSWPLIIYGVALFIQARIDQVMIHDVLKHRMGEDEAFAQVGQYSVALKMIEALGFVPVVVQKSLAPAITRARMEDRGKYQDRLLNQYRLMFLLFLVTAVPLYFIAEPLIVWLYKEPYREAGHLLALFGIRLLFTNMGVAKSSFITNESLFKYSLFTALIGAGVNIAMNYLLIPRFEASGAIIATIGSFVISIFLLDLFFKDTRANFGWMMKGMFTFWRLHTVR
ncbi:MAG: flippase [Flavobacteriales bacterium]|nr:flippase [Flavobacteriales bacterium]MCB9166040.1 flippase [Flavobacteriales bacterium]